MQRFISQTFTFTLHTTCSIISFLKASLAARALRDASPVSLQITASAGKGRHRLATAVARHTSNEPQPRRDRLHYVRCTIIRCNYHSMRNGVLIRIVCGQSCHWMDVKVPVVSLTPKAAVTSPKISSDFAYLSGLHHHQRSFTQKR